MTSPLPQRIIDKIDFNGPGGCWVWTGAINEKGYGHAWIEGKVRRAHKAIYEALVGVVAEGLTLDHLCRRRECVNPEHLEPVTNMENLLRSDRTLGAHHREKTHCPQNHPYDEENTIRMANGARRCRICKSDTNRRYKARRKAAA